MVTPGPTVTSSCSPDAAAPAVAVLAVRRRPGPGGLTPGGVFWNEARNSVAPRSKKNTKLSSCVKILRMNQTVLSYGVLVAYVLIFSIYAILIKAESIDHHEKQHLLLANCFVPSLLISAAEILKAVISLILLAFESESKSSESASHYSFESLILALRKRDYRCVGYLLECCMFLTYGVWVQINGPCSPLRALQQYLIFEYWNTGPGCVYFSYEHPYTNYRRVI